MKIARSALLLVALPASLAAQQPPAGATANPITTALRGRILALHRNLAQAFDSIPEAKFTYKPTPAQQSIGYIAQHLISDNTLFCNAFGEMKATVSPADAAAPDTVRAKWPRADLIAKLKESFAFCERAMGQLDDAKLAEQTTVTFGNGQSRTVYRANMAVGHALDLADHYSQIANYMRLNGMLPPTALPRPRP